MIDSSSASDQKSCHGLGFESERESSVQSRQRCHWSLASSLMAYRPQNADRRTEKDVTDFHSCDPQKMSYEQGEACHLHTAPARRGFCAEMSQNQTPCNPIRASSLSQKMSRTCRCKNVWHFKCPSAKVAERLALQVPECQGRRRCHGDDLRRAQGSASARLHQSVSGGRRQRLQPSYAGASNVNRVLDQRRVLGRERKTQQPA